MNGERGKLVNAHKFMRKCGLWALVLLLVSGLFGGWAFAEESNRIARIESVTGDVTVKKAGGTRELKAYRNMTLNQGDHIKTGKNSSVVLVVLDQEDKITLGANTSMYLSELKTSAGGTSTKTNLWNGSAYVNASKKNSGDQFRVETPTAVMGIRGTHLSVSQQHGETDVVVYSGIVEAQSSNDAGDANSTGEMVIFPLMHGYITKIYDELQDTSTAAGGASVVDLASLNLDLMILQAIVENKSAIDAENEELLRQIASGETVLPPEMEVRTEQDIEMLNRNISGFVQMLVSSAVSSGLITQEEAERLAAIGNFDLSEPAEMQLNEQQLRRKRQLEEIQRKRGQQRQEQEQRREDQRRQNQELLEKIQNARQQQEQANQEAREDAEKRAVERYMNRLSEEERQQFQQRRQQLNRNQNQGRNQDQTQEQPNNPPPAGPTEPRLTLAEALLENQGDYILEYMLKVMHGDIGVAGLTKENFRILVDGQPFESFSVTAADSAGKYDVTLRFQQEQTLQSLKFDVDYEGMTASKTLESVVVKAPRVSFDVKSLGNDQYRFDVNLANFSNIIGAQVHVVYTDGLVPVGMQTLKFDTAAPVHQTFENRKFDFSQNQNDKPVVEEMYAFVLKPGQSAARNDIGSTPQALLSLTIRRPQFLESAWVALAQLIIITETGEYIYTFPGGQGSNIHILPGYYLLD